MNTNQLINLLPDMAILVTVVEAGSFSAASTRLNLSPSAVSRSVSKLEAALQVRLLERTTRRLNLSTAGREVFQQCQSMLASARVAASAAQAKNGEVVGLLRVAAPKAFARRVLTPLVLEFIRRHPKVSVHFKVVDHFIDPISDEVDVIFSITDAPVPGLVARPLINSRLLLCASPEYLARNGTPTTPQQLKTHQCIRIGEEADDLTWEFFQGDQKVAVIVDGPIAVNHSEIRRESALQGLGIAVFPEFTVTDYLLAGTLIRVLPDWQLGGRYQGVVMMQYARSKYVPNQQRVFVDFVQQHFAGQQNSYFLPE
ncbi:LysR family transcriptional regulator [Gynuella sp.]|uniref:LysR family transcriptional regulator n=1 Tax=Gynuella sp. TaxID=2969146 RepID=UPI003D133359